MFRSSTACPVERCVRVSPDSRLSAQRDGGRSVDVMPAAHASPRGVAVALMSSLPGYTVPPMIDSYPEQPIEQTPENYHELQAMVFYADPLFIGRNGAWLSSQAVLLAIGCGAVQGGAH